MVDGQLEKDGGTGREAHGIEGAVGQSPEDQVVHLGIGGHVGGTGCRAVAQEIDGDERSAEITEDVDPAVLLPGVVEGGGEAVNQDDRCRVSHDRPQVTSGPGRPSDHSFSAQPGTT